jgi:AraC family transcriptional regulator
MSGSEKSVDKLDVLLSGTTAGGLSDVGPKWHGLTIDRRWSDTFEKREEVVLDHHHVLVWENEPSVWEFKRPSGQFARHVKKAGSLSVGPAGVQPEVRAHTPFKMIACLIDPRVVAQVAEEADLPPPNEFNEHLGGHDPALSQLVALSASEAVDGGASGTLYADSLSMAIFSRFIKLAHDVSTIQTNHEPYLSKPRLRRVLELIAADFSENLSLETLAAESGYSRAHFLRMFRSATGKTPHRYLQDVRLEHARQQLLAASMSITEIAHSSGFASHAHMTKLFHEKFGVPPSTYRASNSTSMTA